MSFLNPADLSGGAEEIAWAEAQLLAGSRRVAFVSASPSAADAPFAQFRVGAWTRRLYRPAGDRRNPFVLAAFHLLSLFNPPVLIESLRLFRRLRPTSVHTHNLIALSPAIWLAARLAGASVVHTHHDLWLLCERATMTDAAGQPCNESQSTCRVCRALRAPKNAQLSVVSSEIFPSSWLREQIARPGTVVQSFATSSHPDEHGQSGLAPSVVYLGALTPHKLGVLFEAYELASNMEVAAVRLLVAGSGPLAGRVTRAAAVNPNIAYLGQIDAAARDRVLASATAVVIPSTCAENSPLVFFEALAARLPVIASDIGGMSELERFGNTILVPPGNVAALAAALASISDDGRMADLREKARRHAGVAAPERYLAEVSAVIERATSPFG